MLADLLFPDDFDLLTLVELLERVRLEEPELFILLAELLLLLELDGRRITCLGVVELLDELLLLESVIRRSFVDLLSGELLLRFRVE